MLSALVQEGGEGDISGELHEGGDDRLLLLLVEADGVRDVRRVRRVERHHVAVARLRRHRPV